MYVLETVLGAQYKVMGRAESCPPDHRLTERKINRVVYYKNSEASTLQVISRHGLGHNNEYMEA